MNAFFYLSESQDVYSLLFLANLLVLIISPADLGSLVKLVFSWCPIMIFGATDGLLEMVAVPFFFFCEPWCSISWYGLWCEQMFLAMKILKKSSTFSRWAQHVLSKHSRMTQLYELWTVIVNLFQSQMLTDYFTITTILRPLWHIIANNKNSNSVTVRQFS